MGGVWVELIFGGNTIRNCSGVVIADGQELVYLERGERDSQLLLTIDVFSAEGERVAKLRRNAWAFQGEGFDITTGPDSLQLTRPGGVVLEARVLDRDRIEVPHGQLYTPDQAGQLAPAPA